jgi:hypothetical protein
MHYLSNYFDKELYVFRTDLLSIIRSLNTVYTAHVCRTSYVDCLLARSGYSILTSLAVNITSMTCTCCCLYNFETPDDGQ